MTDSVHTNFSGGRRKPKAAGMNQGVEALRKELDNVSRGSGDSIEEAAAARAIEEATVAEEQDRFFEAEADAHGAINGELTEAERESLEQELKKTEDEIATLRQVLAARIKHASDLKHKLGLSPWTQVTHDVSEGLAKVKETNAYQRTSEVVQTTTDTVSKKLGQIKQSNAFKSFEQSIGSAYTSVKAKVTASTSMNQLYSGGQQGNTNDTGTGASTQPTTPSGTKSPLS